MTDRTILNEEDLENINGGINDLECIGDNIYKCPYDGGEMLMYHKVGVKKYYRCQKCRAGAVCKYDEWTLEPVTKVALF